MHLISDDKNCVVLHNIHVQTSALAQLRLAVQLALAQSRLASPEQSNIKCHDEQQLLIIVCFCRLSNHLKLTICHLYPPYCHLRKHPYEEFLMGYTKYARHIIKENPAFFKASKAVPGTVFHSTFSEPFVWWYGKLEQNTVFKS